MIGSKANMALTRSASSMTFGSASEASSEPSPEYPRHSLSVSPRVSRASGSSSVIIAPTVYSSAGPWTTSPCVCGNSRFRALSRCRPLTSTAPGVATALTFTAPRDEDSQAECPDELAGGNPARNRRAPEAGTRNASTKPCCDCAALPSAGTQRDGIVTGRSTVDVVSVAARRPSAPTSRCRSSWRGRLDSITLDAGPMSTLVVPRPMSPPSRPEPITSKHA